MSSEGSLTEKEGRREYEKDLTSIAGLEGGRRTIAKREAASRSWKGKKVPRPHLDFSQ